MCEKGRKKNGSPSCVSWRRAKLKIMRAGGFRMYRISIFSSDPPLLYKYTVSGGGGKSQLRHLCTSIGITVTFVCIFFLWLMSPKCCVFQMRSQFICMIFCTWCKFGDKLVKSPIFVGMALSDSPLKESQSDAPGELHLWDMLIINTAIMTLFTFV